MAGEGKEYCWAPQVGPQHALVSCPVFEIFYGGARGGGKTDGMLGKFGIKQKKYGRNCVGVFFRKTREDLKEAIERSKDIYGPMGATYEAQNKQWVFRSGARLKFEYLASDKDAENYQGHNYTDVFFEELTHWLDPAPVNKLKATLRSAEGVPCQFHATGNPGGPGHHWVKARYIDPAPHGMEILTEVYHNPFTGETQTLERIFIPSKLSDNRLLMDGDPLYVAKLQQSGSPQLVKAWLEGDWNIIEGAYFPEFGARHIIQPFKIPEHWTRYRAFDWGSFRPFANLWIAVCDGGHPDFQRGDLIVYREYYGWNGTPNEGMKMTADEVADAIKAHEKGEKITFSVGDPSMFKVDGGPSIAEKMALKGVIFARADNSRITGWNELRRRLKGDEVSEGVFNNPSLYIFSTCVNLIRTLPIAQHDQHKPEDIDSDGEDHLIDALRYGVMARYGVQERPRDAGSNLLASNVFKVRPKSARV